MGGHVKSARPHVSAEIFAVPLEAGRYLIYSPLEQAAFVGNAITANMVSALTRPDAETDAIPPNLIEFLSRLGMLGHDAAPLPVEEFRGVPEPTSVTLFLTTACNLRCTYCYASAGDTPAKSMSLETACRGIDFVAANARKKGEPNFEINYHGGGEPSANWKVLTASLGYANELSGRLGLLPPRASAASNGVLRDDQIDWIVGNLNGGISLSFDGLPEAHDKHRLTVLGQGSSERVMRTMRRFDDAKYPYGIRVTVTHDQIPQLADSIDFICANFGAARIQVEPAYQLGRWSDAPSAETSEFIAAYRGARGRAALHGREVFFSAARVGTLTNHFCGMTQDLFALSPDGNVSACYEVFAEDNQLSPVFFYGEGNADGSGYSFDMQRLERLRGQAVQNREYCEGCFAKWTCAGDCFHKAVSVTGSLEFQGTDRCHITRELTKDQILERIAASGGLYWHEERQASGAVRGKEALL